MQLRKMGSISMLLIELIAGKTGPDGRGACLEVPSHLHCSSCGSGSTSQYASLRSRLPALVSMVPDCPSLQRLTAPLQLHLAVPRRSDACGVLKAGASHTARYERSNCYSYIRHSAAISPNLSTSLKVTTAWRRNQLALQSSR